MSKYVYVDDRGHRLNSDVYYDQGKIKDRCQYCRKSKEFILVEDNNISGGG
jgi:hypothetical protein